VKAPSLNIVLTTLNAKYIHTSLALRYLKAQAQGEFENIKIMEYTIKDVHSHIVSELFLQQPDVIGFSVYIWNVEETISVLQMVRQVLPTVKIILGGPEVSYDVRSWMERLPEVDIIVMGEGEESFLEILQNLRDHKSCEIIAGIAHRQGLPQSIKINSARPKPPLETIRNPYADTIDVASLRNRIVYYETSRGCPFSCQFCLSSIESGVRYFPLQRVKQELGALMDAGIRTIKFVDRTFNLNRTFALDVFQFLIDYPAQTVFQFEITGDILPLEIVEFLADHAPIGKFRFELGVQSTNDVTNTLVQRRQNFSKLSRTIESLKASGKIVQHLDLIAGLPEENYESFKKTFNDVFVFEPEELQLGFLKMLRGTGLRERAQQHDYVFSQRAPYEILGNNVLPYRDIIRIKQVEDVLEKYWNDNRMRDTVKFLTTRAFASPFDFFQSFGTFWDEHGYSRIGHQLEDLFTRLQAFLTDNVDSSLVNATKALMMVDYLRAFRTRPNKHWWPNTLSKQREIQIRSHLKSPSHPLANWIAQHALTETDIEKHTVIESLPYDLQALHSAQDMAPQPSILIVHYPVGLMKGERPEIVTFLDSQHPDTYFQRTMR